MSSRLPFCLFSVFFSNLDFKVQVSGNDSLGTANIAINLAAHLRGRQRYGEVGRDEAHVFFLGCACASQSSFEGVGWLKVIWKQSTSEGSP